MNLSHVLDVIETNAQHLVLGALVTSSLLRGLEKLTEYYGERHPASRFWPAADRFLDRADKLIGWVGDAFQRVVFTRKSTR